MATICGFFVIYIKHDYEIMVLTYLQNNNNQQ